MNSKLRRSSFLFSFALCLSTQCMAISPTIPVTIQSIPGFNANQLAQLLDNKGREWIPSIPLNTDVVFGLSQPRSHLLFQWMGSFNYSYNVIRYGAPRDYIIQVSSDSTDGSNGNWKTVANVQNNPWAARAHEIQENNVRWIRFRATGKHVVEGSEVDIGIDEFDIHDLSQCQPGGACDTWGFIGDSITADTFWRNPAGGQPFNELVNACSSARHPSMINFGVGENRSDHVLARLQQTISDNPGIYHWAIGIGSNDGDVAQYEQNLVSILDRLLANGKQPILARIPYSTSLPDSRIQSLNAVVDRLTAQYKLPAGPDLYSHFRQNPSHLRDGIHPTYTEGAAAIQGLWAQTACGSVRSAGSANVVVTGALTAQTILGNLIPDTDSLGKMGQVFVLLNLAPFTDQDGSVITTDYTLWTYSNDVLSWVVPELTIAQMCANAPAYYSGPLQVMQNMPLIPVATDLSLFAGSEAYIGYGKEEGLPAIQGAACMDMVTNGTVWLVHILK